MGCVLQFGERVHKRVHYYYYGYEHESVVGSFGKDCRFSFDHSKSSVKINCILQSVTFCLQFFTRPLSY